MKYPLASSTWDDKEIEALKRVISSQNFTMGEMTLLFEQQMAQYLDVNYCVMVNSGSSANLLAIASLFYTKESPLKKNDEVIVPAVSWGTTFSPLCQYGLKVKFVDVDETTFNMDLSSLETAITEKTRVVFAVNLLGNPNDFDKLTSICRRHNLILLEDNCESLGATFNGRQAGTFGRMGTFSSFFSHHISTMEGGFIATNDKEIYHILLSLRSHGWTRHLPSENLVSGKKSTDPFEESFKFVLPGYNVRPTELSAAIGVEQIKKLPGIVDARRKNALVFYDKMANFQNTFHLQQEVGKSSFFGFPLVLKNGTKEKRKSLVSFLTDKEIETRPIVAGNFTNNPAMKYFDYSIHNELIFSEKIHQNGLFVGNHHYDMEREIEWLQKVLEDFF